MLRRRSLGTLLILGIFVTPALGQDKVNLSWKFEKDKTFYQEMSTETKQTMKVMGQDIVQEQKQTFYFSWTPKEQDKDMNWVIAQKILGVKMNINIGGNTISYDSTNPGQANNPLSDFFKALVGSEFTLTVNPQMEVTKIEGRQQFVEKLVAANPQMKPLLEQILSEDSLKQMADPMFAVVPSKEVAKGDKWERKTTLSLGPIGGYATTYTYTLDSVEKDIATISVKTDLKYSAPEAAMAGNGLPFKIKSGELTPKESSGTIKFNVKAGRMESADLNLTLDGKLSIEVSGTTTEVDLNQVQKTTIKATDTDPLKK